ncbi:MAG: glycosyltransferase [Alphaproteobacteria bacterium]|nr:glycosyltransferase [Alphaproteobacteria bacterium]
MSDLQKPICYLICVFNDQQGLDTTLASVFEDEPLADILVVDDGSMPAMKLPKAPEGFRLLHLPLEKNLGLIGALNSGLKFIIEKDYIYTARLDAGDTVNKGRLRAQHEFLEVHPSIGILGTDVQAFDSNNGQKLFRFNNPSKPKAVSRLLKIKNCLAHPSVMIRTQAFSISGPYDPSFKYAEDYEMWRRIEKFFGAANLPDIYVNKEISPHQMTAINRKGSILSRLRAQLKYFKPFNIWCWIGVMRSIIGLMIPRSLWKFLRTGQTQSS